MPARKHETKKATTPPKRSGPRRSKRVQAKQAAKAAPTAANGSRLRRSNRIQGIKAITPPPLTTRRNNRRKVAPPPPPRPPTPPPPPPVLPKKIREKDDFSEFAVLPKEIQIIIWEFVIAQIPKRYIQIALFNETPKHRRKIMLNMAAKVPVPLKVCHQSRSLALKRWKLLKLTPYEPLLYIDFATDTLVMDFEHPRPAYRDDILACGKALRDEMSKFYGCEILSTDISTVGNLRTRHHRDVRNLPPLWVTWNSSWVSVSPLMYELAPY